MKFRFLILSLLCGLSAWTQSIDVHSSKDSLRGVVSAYSDEKSKRDAYQEIFEFYRMSQFELAFWAAKGGLSVTPINQPEKLAFFTEAVGYAYQKLFVMDSALIFYLEAVDLYDGLGQKSESARVLDAIARIHRKLQNHDKALWYYGQAFAIYDERDDDEGRARILNERGAVYENMGETRKALDSYQESLKIQRVRNDSVGIGYSLEFIGYNYMQQDSLALSEEYLLQALNYRQNMDDDFALMLNEYALGELYHKKGEYTRSDEHINHCFALSEKLSFVDIRQYALDIAIENRKAQGDFEHALELMEKRTLLSDSLDQVANQARVDELSEKYQSVERENQILIQKAEIQQQNYWIYGLSAASVLFVLIAFLIYKQQRLRNAQIVQEAELKLAMNTIETQNRLQQLRVEISRDLHDNIGTQLTFVISSIDSVKHLLLEGGSSTVQNRLERISRFTRETIRELRDTIWAMNAADITLNDLKDRIYTFIDQAGHSMNGVDFSFVDEVTPKEEVHFNSRDGMTVYRIVQEAVNNAMKHAQASSIQVKMSIREEQLYFLIRDNGTGMKEGNSSGHGMTTMRKRAEEVNGQLTISSTSEGTRVELHLSKPES